MDTSGVKILIVDDEEDILEILQYNLTKAGYIVYTASDGREAIKKAKKVLPDIILLDVMMPHIDGIQACEDIRQIPELQHCIIAFLTARGEDYSEIAGLQAGADDYITKPIRPKVLIARLHTLLKRRQIHSQTNTSSKTIEFDSIRIDEEKHIVYFKDRELNLPNKEFKLLLLLATKPERVFTRDEIYTNVWGTDIVVGDRTIDVHIRKLREKLDEEYIDTIKGIGYTFIKRQ
ncbi:MAG TPA: response regulator transcription factor [Bacteroidales bacterium]|nr:response regulator transcription factor [Bacteroidales bacterium]